MENTNRLIHAGSFAMSCYQDKEGKKTEVTGKSIGEKNKQQSVSWVENKVKKVKESKNVEGGGK